MLLDQNRSLQCASRQVAVRLAFRILRNCAFLLLDADEHFSEQKAFELLPRATILADADGAMETQSPESARINVATRRG